MTLRPLHSSRHAVGFAAARRASLWDAVRFVLLLVALVATGTVIGVWM